MIEKPLFSDKIKYLYKRLNIPEYDFIKLFCVNTEKSVIYARTKTIKKWLNSNIVQTKGFYYDSYPIANLKINNITAFSSELFLYASLKEFKLSVDNYVEFNQKNLNPQKTSTFLPYRFIYYYDLMYKEIKQYKVSFLEKLSDTQYKIRLEADEIYSNMEIYKGIFYIERNNYYLFLENTFEKLTFYFAKPRGINNDLFIYGLGLGLSYESELPLGNKVVLSTEALNIASLDLELNKMEILLLEKTRLPLNEQAIYLNTLYNKLKTLYEFINTDNILNNIDLYSKIFLKNFTTTQKIIKKLEISQNYYLYQENMVKIFTLQEMSKDKTDECYILTDISNQHYDLLNEKDREAKKILECFSVLVKNILKLNLIFIVKTKTINKYFIETLNKLTNVGACINLILEEDLKKIKLFSNDFIISKQHNTNLHKIFLEKKASITISKDITIRKYLFSDFQKLKQSKYTYSLNKFLEKNSFNPKLEKLVGTFYYYYVGSSKKTNKNGEYIIWKDVVTINNLGEVVIKCENKIFFTGVIKTNHQHQIFIELTDNSGYLAIIVFDVVDIHKTLFLVRVIDKQYNSNYDMVSFSIFSKIELEDKTIHELFKADKKYTLLHNEVFNKRIIDLNSLYELGSHFE